LIYAVNTKAAQREASTNHVSTELRHNIIAGEFSAIPAANSRTDAHKNATFFLTNGENKLIYFDSNKSAYVEYPQRGIIYHKDNHLCRWDGGSFVTLTIS
jgi:hypothetical protein